jgi:hypothetical protein
MHTGLDDVGDDTQATRQKPLGLLRVVLGTLLQLGRTFL